MLGCNTLSPERSVGLQNPKPQKECWAVLGCKTLNSAEILVFSCHSLQKWHSSSRHQPPTKKKTGTKKKIKRAPKKTPPKGNPQDDVSFNPPSMCHIRYKALRSDRGCVRTDRPPKLLRDAAAPSQARVWDSTASGQACISFQAHTVELSTLLQDNIAYPSPLQSP